MKMQLPKSFKLSKEISAARQRGLPIVALESTVITHGLPRPQNLQLARNLESIVRSQVAVPATIAVLDGRVCVGLEPDELEALAANGNARKVSSRDLASAVADKASSGTTVAATLRIAAMAGIHVFATGGIGGVHRPFLSLRGATAEQERRSNPQNNMPAQWDVSADLAELSRQPVLLVCAGAKAILDLPATLEQLETLGVPVIGYQTNNFPAFYSVESGLPTSARADDPQYVAELARKHWELGGGGLLLAAPPPAESALPRADVESWIAQAVNEADAEGIRGQAVSPFLLKRVSELSGGKSLEANLALLKNNAMIAAGVAKALGTKATKIA
jgi:pseudouridine-5'-phosphate glycosidase